MSSADRPPSLPLYGKLLYIDVALNDIYPYIKTNIENLGGTVVDTWQDATHILTGKFDDAPFILNEVLLKEKAPEPTVGQIGENSVYKFTDFFPWLDRALKKVRARRAKKKNTIPMIICKDRNTGLKQFKKFMPDFHGSTVPKLHYNIPDMSPYFRPADARGHIYNRGTAITAASLAEKDNKPGYCEICKRKYQKYKEHITQARDHIEAVEDDKLYESIDTLLGIGPRRSKRLKSKIQP